MFEIEDETYSVEPQKEYDDRSMNVKLGSVLRDGTKFSYEYDFGTTTSLDLKVVSTHHPSWQGGTAHSQGTQIGEICADLILNSK